MTEPSQTGRVLLVTGGSRGIGAAIARLAAARGYRVAFTYRCAEAAAAEVVADIEAMGGTAIAIKTDMADPEAIIALFETIDSAFGRLDALVNNAGIVDQAMRLDTMSAERLHRMMAINVTAPMLCTREAVKRMSCRHGHAGGSIVMIGSAASHRGSANEYVDYAASKGAIDALSEGLSKELAADGIRVNTVRPGVIDTDIHVDGGRPNKARDASHRIPMGRPGQPEEIARAVLWLSSDEASFTTGALLDVDGGV